MKLFASMLLAVVISSCSSAITTNETTVTPSTSSVAVESLSSSSSTAATLATSTSVVASTAPATALNTATATTLPAASRVTTTSQTSLTSSVSATRPRLSVSQTTNLNPNGTSVTVRGTGFDVSKGVYVIVCSQAAPGPQATCIGGVNLDGSSPSSVWVSSNPPNYGIGLTTPFQPDGSFTIELVIVAKSGTLDCTVIKCGVVTRSDHLRYSDRTQDVFIPISFSGN